MYRELTTLFIEVKAIKLKLITMGIPNPYPKLNVNYTNRICIKTRILEQLLSEPPLTYTTPLKYCPFRTWDLKTETPHVGPLSPLSWTTPYHYLVQANRWIQGLSTALPLQPLHNNFQNICAHIKIHPVLICFRVPPLNSLLFQITSEMTEPIPECGRIF